MRDEPISTQEQKDKSQDDKEGEGEGQRKRKGKDESADFSFGVEKESRAKLDAEKDEASGDDDNADFMNANDEQPIKKFCKIITPPISVYEKFETLYSVLRGLVVVNDTPALAGEERVGKWSTVMKVRGKAQYLPPHILTSEATWAKVLDTNPIGMWFGNNKNNSSLIRVIKFYWKTWAPAVLVKAFVIDHQELLFKQNAPRGKLKTLRTVRTPQEIFTDEYGAVWEKKKWLLPMAKVAAPIPLH